MIDKSQWRPHVMQHEKPGIGDEADEILKNLFDV